MGSGVQKATLVKSINDILLNQVGATDVAVSTNAGYDLLPANADLTAAEVRLISKAQREYCLKEALTKILKSILFPS